MYDMDLNEDFSIGKPSSFRSHWWKGEPVGRPFLCILYKSVHIFRFFVCCLLLTFTISVVLLYCKYEDFPFYLETAVNSENGLGKYLCAKIFTSYTINV